MKFAPAVTLVATVAAVTGSGGQLKFEGAGVIMYKDFGTIGDSTTCTKIDGNSKCVQTYVDDKTYVRRTQS